MEEVWNDSSIDLCSVLAFIEVYKHKYGGLKFYSSISENLDLKLRLLQFVTRLAMPFLKNHGQSKVYAEDSYLGSVAQFTSSNVKPVHGGHVQENDRELVWYYQNIEFSALLPEFFYLSANVVDMLEQSPNESWMRLAGEFVLHVAVADFLSEGIPYGVSAEEVFDARISRYRRLDIPSTLPSKLSQDELRLINVMFNDKLSPREDYRASSYLPGWEEILLEFQAAFARNYSIGLNHWLPQTLNFTALGKDYPVAEFIDKVLLYCESVLSFFGTPILVELEKGQLDSLDLSPVETEELKERCGWK